MIRHTIARVLRPLRILAGKFVLLPQTIEDNYIGMHGCIHTASSFTTWNQVEGDYLEFGVATGSSFVAAYKTISRDRAMHAAKGYDDPDYRKWLQHPPKFYAFDSFAGLPEGTVERQVDYAPGSYQCSEDRFRANVASADVDMSRVVTVPGFYDKSLTPETKARLGLRRAAVVMIDCDLYESTVPVLDFITDLVHQGTVLIFHDWFRYKGSPQSGEQRACQEWVARNPQFELIEYWREGPQAVSFLVNFKK